jgi:hypothetical protein
MYNSESHQALSRKQRNSQALFWSNHYTKEKGK